ncbi:DUF3795 domain-containing protein, partial [Candidatus Fermentibacterales bacterium]|nr:DUF3795 domain-containing protein [Candidatus Fermentibacterales bacterium]
RLADRSCKARPCAIDRGLDSCAECEEFPCGTLRTLMASPAGMLLFCLPRTGSITREEYELCMRPFDSMGNLVRKLSEIGRLPARVAGELEAEDHSNGSWRRTIACLVLS